MELCTKETEMETYFESTLEDVMRWELLEQLGDLASVHEEVGDENSYGSQRPPKTVFSLQRDYISLYGSHPKMEDRIYSTCGVCEQVFNPQVVSSHKEHCPGKGKIQSQQIKKKVKSKKKLQGSSVPLPPLFKESPGPPVLSKFSDISPPQVSRLAPDVLPLSDAVNAAAPKANEDPAPSAAVASPPTPPPPPLPPSPVLLPEVSPNEETSSRHKKSKKSTKALREYDPDVHCGVVEGQKGPCTRSITCSNHKIQQRKSVPGRSKNIHVLIAEKKAAKEKESRRRSPTHLLAIDTKSSPEFMFPLIEPEPINCVGDNAEVPDFVDAPKLPSTLTIGDLPENELHDEVESDDPSNQLESGYCSIETSLSTKSSPVLYFNPISPIFVVTPVQFIQKENSVFVEATPRANSPPPNGYFLTMPETSTNIKLYKSHPKPTILPTYGSRKVGGAILGSNQRLEYQRNDIQMAITTKRMAASSTNCKSTSYNVPPQRSILLKTKGINKVNCKRSSTEKLSASDGKQIKLAADVNGFILHTEMSEVAEAPQPNHCIQENINLLNMK
ncbi:ataxin-7-like isoform X2 [Zophobas morio]|uniref:ataxin-7-like isoform X2 n=1 Tax=Zophobas morio TaxID=2755281 RepID=UPI003082F393